MTHRTVLFSRHSVRAVLAAVAILLCVIPSLRSSFAQAGASERAFPQSKAAVEKAIKQMQSAISGRLPVLDGFATSDHPLDHYQRGFYQSKFEVSASPSGGSIVRVSVQVTAWYSDAAASQSGYKVLTSNGRLEADLLDQLSDQLSGKGMPPAATAGATEARKPFPSQQKSSTAQTAKNEAKPTAPVEPAVSAPVPRFPEGGGSFSSSLAQSLSQQEKSASTSDKKILPEESALRAEAESLEEVLKTQAHPKNLVAVKKSGTPVVETASLTAKTLFMASAHDEFEMLDFNRDWVHVRVSGLSRGWIWRNNLEMPGSVPDSDAAPSPVPVAAELFHVTREENAQFPGDWAPLRGKNVKIVSVEKLNEAKDASPQLRLEFAKSVLDKDYAELAQKPQELAGVVVIFDSIDGGMIAATSPALQKWKAGTLSDAALWHQCFFDPPETFNESGTSATQ